LRFRLLLTVGAMKLFAGLRGAARETMLGESCVRSRYIGKAIRESNITASPEFDRAFAKVQWFGEPFTRDSGG
jgi:hypothetical protein